ncbi:uncharacterized protein LOC142339942 [Convolutriloba macropyga]|uniref:uncharacterized protein LOC142339942 n=1 Tax=Convolutriloba macropyga TaxID=536237 RepID=UPI003F51CD36
MKIKIIFIYFTGTGFAEADSEAFREFLMASSDTLEGLFFDNYLSTANEVGLTDLHLNRLEIFQYRGGTGAVNLDSITTTTAAHQNFRALAQNSFDYPGFLMRNIRVENEFLKHYINRAVKQQYFEWTPELSEENYFLPHLFSSPYPPQHWYEDVVIKLGSNQNNTAPKILTKEFLLHAGAVTLLCLPDTLE